MTFEVQGTMVGEVLPDHNGGDHACLTERIMEALEVMGKVCRRTDPTGWHWTYDDLYGVIEEHFR